MNKKSNGGPKQLKDIQDEANEEARKISSQL